MDQHQHILVAKVAMLEQVCLALLIDRAAKEQNPIAWVDGFGSRFRGQVEKKAAQMPKEIEAEISSVVALEVLDTFFDKLRGALAKREK